MHEEFEVQDRHAASTVWPGIVVLMSEQAAQRGSTNGGNARVGPTLQNAVKVALACSCLSQATKARRQLSTVLCILRPASAPALCSRCQIVADVETATAS